MNLRRELGDVPPETQPAGKDSVTPQNVRTPKTVDEVANTLKTPGTTLIDPQLGRFLFLPTGTDSVDDDPPEEVSLLLEGRLATNDGQVQVVVSGDGWAVGGTIRFRAEAGRITAVPVGTGGALDISTTLAGQANTFLEEINKQFADEGLEVVSVSADLKTGMIKVVTVKGS